MARNIYPKFLEHCLNVTLNGGSAASANIKACLVTSAYTYSTAHEFLSSVTGIEETSGNLASKTVTAGVFDAADVTFTGTSGTAAAALVLYVDTGVAGTSRLIAYDDTITGFPVTLGGDVTVRWNASGILALLS
jgi:hypothetical protein